MASYVRDRDARTRGVGAVAAVDHVSDALRRRQLARARAMARRDMTMAKLSRDAFSARAALGAVDIQNVITSGQLGAKLASPIIEKRPSSTSLANLSATLGIKPTATTTTGPRYVAPGTGTQFLPVSTTLTKPPKRPGFDLNPGANLIGGGGAGTSGGGSLTVSPTVSSGQSGGGGGGGGGATPEPEPAPPDLLPEEPPLDEGMSITTPKPNYKRLLLLAGLAAGAYYLYKRNKG
jgi:hypothetical protein